MSEQEIRERVIRLVVDTTGITRDDLVKCYDIESDLGCTGDDYFELIDAYAKEFNVDMSGFRWYFHTHDESMATFDPFPSYPPSMQVERIPVSLNLLVEKALSGTWDLVYPAHVLLPRQSTSDKVVRWLFILLFILIFVFMIVRAYV